MRKFLAIAVVAALVLGALGGVAAAQDKVIKLGTLYPLTGPCATAGQRCKAAVMTAVEVINNAHPDLDVPLAAQEGVMDGYKFELVHADTQGKPNVGKSEAERLFNQEGVWAILGSYNSAVTKPASFVAERKGKIFMCGCSSSAALTERNFKHFFRIAPTDKTESHEFVTFMDWVNEKYDADIETVGLIYENTEFGKHAAEEGKAAADEAGYEVVADVAFSPGATTMDSEVQSLKAADPDVVFGACLGGDYTLWVRTMKKMNWLPKMSLNYCTGYQDPMIAKQLGDDGNYFMGGTGYSPQFADLMPAVAAVEEIYKEITEPSVPFDSDSIKEAAAMFVLAQAIEKAGELDHDKVAKTLHSNTWEAPLTLSGEVAFVPGGQNELAMSYLTQLQGGDYKIIYPPEVANAELVYPMVPWEER
ncbi:MAG: ABC transporter substrate-binding protein [Synergistales bacterium]|nr:ABC transporter substrate-binding protein [Synergistales bacterium]